MLKCFIVCLCLLTTFASAQPVGDLVDVEGIRDNQITGYGLVVGLDGTGDKSMFTQSSLQTYLDNHGIRLPDGVIVRSKNVAAVIVNANLPSFSSVGQELDVTVSSIGDAKSLRGGMLVLTPLKGVDGKTYALAQGNLLVGGMDESGADGSNISINISSVGRIAGGATVEVPFQGSLVNDGNVVLNLKNPSFELAGRVNDAINDVFGYRVSKTVNHSKIKVEAPLDSSELVEFISRIQTAQVDMPRERARVVVNSRAGTVIITDTVTVAPVAITHGGITLEVEENPSVGLLTGELEQDSTVSVAERNRRVYQMQGGANLNEIVDSFNEMGLAPSDVVAILEALKSSGSLRAELVII